MVFLTGKILWKKGNDMIDTGDDSLIFKDAFDFLCQFYDIFFPRDYSPILVDLRSQERFWHIVQVGVTVM